MEPHLILHCCRCGAAYHQGVPVRTSCGQESRIRRRPGARGGVLQIVVVVERAGESGVEMVLAAAQHVRTRAPYRGVSSTFREVPEAVHVVHR